MRAPRQGKESAALCGARLTPRPFCAASSEDRRESFYHERVSEVGPRYEEFDLLSTQTALDLIYTCDVFHQVTARYMADYGLSKSSLNILMLLRHGPDEGMQLHDLGELLLVSRANITGLIDSLQEKGWVERRVDANDRRVRYARITDKAEALLDEFMPVHFRHVKALLRDLSIEEKESFSALLKKARRSMTKHGAGSAVCEAPRS
jgi:MarR family transcriptional regulator, 2-MHQ and catechol-resistance regulon repressor